MSKKRLDTKKAKFQAYSSVRKLEIWSRNFKGNTSSDGTPSNVKQKATFQKEKIILLHMHKDVPPNLNLGWYPGTRQCGNTISAGVWTSPSNNFF